MFADSGRNFIRARNDLSLDGEHPRRGNSAMGCQGGEGRDKGKTSESRVTALLGISGNILGWTGQVHSFIGTLLATALYNFLLKDPLRQFIQCFCFLEGCFCLAQCQAVRED